MRLLHVEDAAAERQLVRELLERESPDTYRIVEADSRATLEARLAEGPYDLILSDFHLPDIGGLQILELARARQPAVPLVFISGTGSEEFAVEAMKQGAADYVVKTPNRLWRLPVVLESAVARRRMEVQRAAFSALGQQLSAVATLHAAGEAILGVADTLLGWDAAFVGLVGSASAEENIIAVCAWDMVEGRRVPLPREALPDKVTPLLRRVLAGKGEMILREPPATFGSETIPFGDATRPSLSLLYVPVRCGQQVTGVLSIQSYTPHKYTQEDLDTLQALADHGGGALERVRQEARARDQARLLDLAHEAIIVRGIDGHIEFVNEAAERLYGWPRSELVGRDARELIRGDPGPFERATQHLQQYGLWEGEVHARKRDGREMVVQSSWTLVNSLEGRGDAVLVIDTDVTEKKQIEAQYLRAQRLQSIGTLASGVAHDLNNILTPIMMFAPMLRGQLKDESLAVVLDAVEASAKRGAEIVRQVLAFGGGLTTSRRPIQTRHLLKACSDLASETFPRSITIHAGAPIDLWLVEGDSTQLEQVLMNLCMNARDAMPKGGVLTIAADNVTLDELSTAMIPDSKAGPYVVWLVADTGVGIPPECLDRIFDPFFTTKEPGRGTGLGLSTALGIVRSHRGFIQTESRPGAGTQFRVYLPAIPASTPPAEGESGKLPQGHGELILVVDDEAAIRRVTGNTLTRHGYRVLTAADGAEAVAIYVQNRDHIQLVLTDLMMPVMDGRSTIRYLRNLDPEVKIIASSGLGSEGAPEEGNRPLGDAFLCKPYSTSDLLVTLRQVIEPAPNG